MDDSYFDEPPASKELVTVAAYDDAVSARLALSHLRAAGLRAALSDESTVAMDWLLSNAIGGIKLQVNAKDIATARRLIEEHEWQLADIEGMATPVGFEVDEERWGAKSIRFDAEDVTGAEDEYEYNYDNKYEDEADLDEELPLTARERDGARAFRGALLGILFAPIELYVLYLVYKVFVSTERLGPRYCNMAIAAAAIMLIVLGGCYAIVRSL